MATNNRNPGLLDPAAIAKGEALGIIARGIVEGYRVGEHRSPFHGFAIEFAQHREYSIGDDTRHLDWKVLGKTDRYYIKQYEQDTNFVVHLCVDGSESMNYGSGSISKLDYAKVLAACLAYLVLSQSDAVAVNIFDTEVRDRFERTDSRGRIHEIMDRLASFQATEATRAGKVLMDLASQIRSKSIVILISDLFDDEESILKSIERIRFQGSEVIVFHVLDPFEIDFPFKGTVKFVGLEGGPEIETIPSSIRKSYLESFKAFCARMRAMCDRCSCHYVLCNTGHHLHETLGEYLAFRRSGSSR